MNVYDQFRESALRSVMLEQAPVATSGTGYPNPPQEASASGENMGGRKCRLK